jgi:hypothetical protein
MRHNCEMFYRTTALILELIDEQFSMLHCRSLQNWADYLIYLRISTVIHMISYLYKGRR